jgi:4,5-DOPA dioxygenase extradiol
MSFVVHYPSCAEIIRKQRGNKMETVKMPLLFIGHGSPTNAIEDNEFSRGWREAAKTLPRPDAILCISAHWETQGSYVTAMVHPRTIHDFYGFPEEMYKMKYPAPGSSEIANLVRKTIHGTNVLPDQEWGLDHGTWSCLVHLFPKADIPVLQLSLDRSIGAEANYRLGVELNSLRDEGILIIGSGNIVHNLRMVVWEDRAFDWAVEFDAKLKQWMLDGDHDPIIHYEKQGQAAALAVNSAEHYLPLLYVLGAQQAGEPISFFNEKVWGGSLSMRCVRLG